MTSDVYEKWLTDIDSRFSTEKRKVLDNCTAHIEISSFHTIRVEYRPQNETSVVQTINQKIINSFKLPCVILCIFKHTPFLNGGDKIIVFVAWKNRQVVFTMGFSNILFM